jgi:hypothetical protein
MQPTGLALAGAPEGSAAGMLPTTTQPPGRIASPVERPTPPGQRSLAGSEESFANSVSFPLGESSTRVVPCTLALSLKLLTRVSPLTSLPEPVGTTSIPYGLTSPFDGTVEPIRTGLPRDLMKELAVLAGACDVAVETALRYPEAVTSYQ